MITSVSLVSTSGTSTTGAQAMAVGSMAATVAAMVLMYWDHLGGISTPVYAYITWIFSHKSNLK